MHTTQELIDLIRLEPLEENMFRGQNYQAPWNRVFGGQVLAQSLNAATRTVDRDRSGHSVHAYFILPGDIAQPIIYLVDRIRDGGSFTTRRVVAVQKGRPIFNMSASFQLRQAGLDHQIKMPQVPAPEALKTDVELIEAMDDVPRLFRGALIPRPIEFRPVESFELMTGQAEAKRHVWMRAKDPLPDDAPLHQQMLAFCSDYNLLSTALLPHAQSLEGKDLQLASLDHAMWFHRDFKMDAWLLFELESPSASNTRGFSRGNFFSQDGKLVASVVQEGLMRIKPIKSQIDDA